MNRTDEMKLGDQQRGFCDCNQGRLPCTCRDRTAELCRRNLANDVEITRLMAQFPGPLTVDPATIRLNDEPLLPNREAERPEIQMVGSSSPIERFSVAAQLQLMKALAILGWAAFILELLRV